MTNVGEKIAIIGLGNFYHLGEKVAKKLKEKYNADKLFKNYEQYDYKVNDEICIEQNNKMIKYKNNME